MNLNLSELPFSLLEKEYQSRNQQLTNMLDEKESLERQLAELEQRIEQFKTGNGTSKKPTKTNKNIVPKATKSTPAIKANIKSNAKSTEISKARTGSVVDHSLQILKENQKPMYVGNLAAAILKRGYNTSSELKTFQRSIRKALARDKRFIRVSPGVYTLATV